eukprot:Gb_20269 [translate_table: standard]
MEYLFNALMAIKWAVLLCVVSMLQLQSYSHGWNTAALTPPQGNSLKMKLKAYRGKYVYRCQNSTWIPILATADLVNISDYKTSFGNYSLVFRQGNPKFAGIWYLLNSGGDSAESGADASVVSGQEIASEPSDYSGVPQILAEATYHQNYGIASQISYIQRLFTKGGIPPSPAKCTNIKNSSKSKYPNNIVVPFEAEFWFYTQDFLPPAVPASIAVPSGRMVQGFFCKGVALYTYDGSAWQRKDVHGKLYNVPGGYQVGTYYIRSPPDRSGGNFCLETMKPTAWIVTAKVVSQSVQLSSDSLSWTLYKITSSEGDTKTLGPFNYFQMIGTRGGLPPKPSNATAKGQVWKAIFTNQFWIYSSY